MKRKPPVLATITALLLAPSLSLALPGIKKPKIKKPFEDVNEGQVIDAGTDVVKAATLTDEDVKNIASQYAGHSDSSHSIAPEDSEYAQRLAKLTEAHTEEEGLALNFKVYLVDEVNAFALADGSVRVYSGLLDLMEDDEVLFVIGHEIGHVKSGHSKEAMRAAYLASAGRKAVAADEGVTGALATSELGAIGEALFNAKFSRVQETESDDYGSAFLKKHGYRADAAVSALQKLAALSEGKSHILSTHPDPGSRAERLQK